MSTWTHVAGLIRYDDIRPIAGVALRDFYRKVLGQTCKYGDSEDKWARCDVPCGSEGSLQWEMHENPDQNTLAAYTVRIWGDLRDFCDLDEIGRWFVRCTAGTDFLVRQAIVHAQCNGKHCVWITVDEGEKTAVQCLSYIQAGLMLTPGA